MSVSLKQDGKPVTIALDVMGGDYAPKELVKGAIEGASHGRVVVLLVGDPEVVERELALHDHRGLPIKVVPAERAIPEGVPPIQALRQTPRASVAVAAELVKRGSADAFVTMGSTGAGLAVAAFSMGMLEGIERPALGGPIFGLAPHTLLIDLGTNLDCRPSQLLSFAVIGSVFVKKFLGVESPKIALLSVGAEEGKGNKQVKETYALFKESGLPFVGNVEGWDVASGKADVVVCDGFVGNILMKYTEGIGIAFSKHLRKSAGEGLTAAKVEKLAQELFYFTNPVEERGGGPIFGVNGVAIVGHGRSKSPAVANAIQTARLAVEIRFVQTLKEELAQFRGKIGL